MTTAIAEYTPTEQALAEFRNKYDAVVFNVSTGKGMTEAKAARAELRGYRVELEKKRVEIKGPALTRCRGIDSEAKRITAELEALEDPIDEAIKAEEQRKEREKEAKEQAERERIEARHKRFNAIRELPLKAVNATADEIRTVIAEAEAIDPATFDDDVRDAARYEQGIAIASLRAALDRRNADDAEQARIKAELAELADLRAKEAERQAEADRIAAAERERLAAEERRKEDQARADREAEQERIDAERAEQRRKEDAERAEAERKLRDEQANAAAERELLEKDKRAAEIANSTLLSAAADAVAFLKANGHGENVVTLKLEAAIRREPVEQKTAA